MLQILKDIKYIRSVSFGSGRKLPASFASTPQLVAVKRTRAEISAAAAARAAAEQTAKDEEKARTSQNRKNYLDRQAATKQAILEADALDRIERAEAMRLDRVEYENINECGICQETIYGTIKITPCGHRFHPDCICRWFVSCKDRSCKSCPMCRTPFDDIQINQMCPNIVILPEPEPIAKSWVNDPMRPGAPRNFSDFFINPYTGNQMDYAEMRSMNG